MLKSSVAPYKVAPARHPGYLSGGTYYLGDGVIGAAAAPNAVDVLYLAPFYVDSVVTPASFGFRVGTAGTGSSAKIGVWAASASTFKPTGTPLMSNNTGAVTTSGSTNFTLAVTGVALVPGVLYWVGAKHTGTLPTVVSWGSGSAAVNRILGIALATAAAGNFVAVSAPDTYTNNITSTDLTSATFTNVTQTVGAPVYTMTLA